MQNSLRVYETYVKFKYHLHTRKPLTQAVTVGSCNKHFRGYRNRADSDDIQYYR